jgi:tRNA pseudouridine(38-40) synthase
LGLPLPSVQQVVEAAAARILNTDYITCVQVAGRTDQGVHALDQRCALRVPASIDMNTFQEEMNIQLKDKLVAVHRAIFCADEKFVVTRKRYVYVLQIPKSKNDKRPVEGLHEYTRHESRYLDLESMRSALKLMVGTHDVSNLSKRQGQAEGPAIRTVHEAYVSVVATVDELPSFQVTQSPLWRLENHDFWIISVEGSGFLWHQVRRMVSLALKVAQGSWPVDSVVEVMEGKRVGPSSAPSRGLYLCRMWVQGEP